MASQPLGGKNLIKTILVTGLLAGTLDILAACANAYIRSGTSPIRVLQFVASGLFGTDAFSGGLKMAFWGLLMHFLIALTWTLVFFLAYPKISFLSKHKMFSGILYGIFVWLAMNFVVLPLTAVPKFPFNISQAIVGAVILILMIGLPISFFANRYYSNK